jgi:CheY-like chemotaxis protein
MRKLHGKKRQARILVLDDDRTIALTLTDILTEQGYEVATVFSGERALVKAAEFIPDLLVSDVCMDGMNGVEAAIRITALLPGCRVLFLSGLASMAEVLNAAPKRLVYSFTSKPLHSRDFLNAVAYMLPAMSATDDSVKTAVEPRVTQEYPLGRTANAGLIIKNAGTETGALQAVQNKLYAVLLDSKCPDRQGLEMQVQ